MNTHEINNLIKDSKIDTNEISDGYHTFGELYEHRIRLFLLTCRLMQETDSLNLSLTGKDNSFKIIKSRLHNDGSEMKGWFIVQVETEEGQISYHLPDSHWDKSYFIEEVERAEEWDGHSPQDVLERLENLYFYNYHN